MALKGSSTCVLLKFAITTHVPLKRLSSSDPGAFNPMFMLGSVYFPLELKFAEKKLFGSSLEAFFRESGLEILL